MTRFKVILLTALGALAMSLVAASGAQADSATCAFTGAAGPIAPDNTESAGTDPANPLNDETGVEAVQTDLRHGDEGDSPIPGEPLLDTDNGNGFGGGLFNGSTGPATEDGSYSFSTTGGTAGALECLYVDTSTGGADTDVYSGDINSAGEYDNIVCGTGTAEDDTELTEVILGAGLVNPDGPDVTDADYEILFEAGKGELVINDAISTKPGLDFVAGEGFVDIEPSPGFGNCVDEDVTQFQATGVFTATWLP